MEHIHWSVVATVTCGTLMCRTSVGNVPTHNIAKWLVMIDLVHTSLIVLWSRNLFWTVGHISRMDQWGLHRRSRPHHFRWLMVDRNTAVWWIWWFATVKPFSQFEVLLEPISATNLCNLQYALCSPSRFSDAPDVSVWLNHQSFAESWNFPSGDHDFGGVIVFTPRVDQV